MTSEGKTDSLSGVRTVLIADGVNGGVMLSRESFVHCAFREAADAESNGRGEGEGGAWVSLFVVERFALLAEVDAGVRDAENCSISASVVASVTANVCPAEEL